MKILTKLLLSSSLLCISPLTFAACDAEGTPEDCIVIVGDDNDSFGGSGSGGGGSVYGGGGTGDSSGGSQGVGTGNSGGSGQGEDSEEEDEAEPTKPPRQVCMESASVAYHLCRRDAAQGYRINLEQKCSHLGSGGGSIGFITITEDAYAKCKEEEQSIRDHEYSVCAHQQAVDIEACPAV